MNFDLVDNNINISKSNAYDVVKDNDKAFDEVRHKSRITVFAIPPILPCPHALVVVLVADRHIQRFLQKKIVDNRNTNKAHRSFFLDQSIVTTYHSCCYLFKHFCSAAFAAAVLVTGFSILVVHQFAIVGQSRHPLVVTVHLIFLSSAAIWDDHKNKPHLAHWHPVNNNHCVGEGVVEYTPDRAAEATIYLYDLS